MAQNRFIEEISTQKIGQEYEVKVEKHELANGKVFNYHILNLPNFAVIIPKLKDNSYVLIKQYRPSWRRTTIGFPAGSSNGFSENPKITAVRELEEETGYIAGQLDFIGKFRHSSRSTQYCHSFVANKLTMREQKFDEGEYIEELLEVSADQIEEFITNGEIADISMIATWYRYKHLNEHNSGSIMKE